MAYLKQWLIAVIGAVACLAFDPASVRAQADPSGPSVEHLQKQLEQREAVIQELLLRVEALERSSGLHGGQSARVRQGAAPEVQPEPSRVRPDEDAITRALERTLVQTGALLLLPGRVEITPRIGYTRLSSKTPIPFLESGATFLGQASRRRDEYRAGLGLRIGLPLDSQLEVNLPYHLVEQSVVTEVGFAPREETSASGSAFGDVSVGLAHTFFRERGARPDVIGRLRWNSGTGNRSENGVALAGGFRGIGGSLTMIKRQDPLVFVVNVSYDTAFERDNVEPGDTIGSSIGAFLAASPETSLRFVLEHQFVSGLEIGGEKLAGSDRRPAVLTIGGSTVLRRGLLLDVAAGIGLTDDSPDYSLNLSLPIRF